MRTGKPCLSFAGSRPAAGYFLCAAKESNQRNAAPPRWFFAAQRTSLPLVKKRGASQLDLVWKMGSDSMFRARVQLMLTKMKRKSSLTPSFQGLGQRLAYCSAFFDLRSAAQKGPSIEAFSVKD
jgi:hypothetical protein